jgi:hypothetical protein
MTRYRPAAICITILAAILATTIGFAATASANDRTPTDLPICDYATVLVIEGPCRPELVLVDQLPTNASSYIGSVATPDGMRAAECVHHSRYQTLCVLGALLPTLEEIEQTEAEAAAAANPCTAAGTTGYLVKNADGNNVCQIQVEAASGDGSGAIAVPVPSFTG